MRSTLTPILVPAAILGAFTWGVYWLMTHQYDRGFAWVVVIGAASAGVFAVALNIFTVNNRLRELEARGERIAESSLRSPTEA